MRRALCVGIDEYAFGPLHGCVSDAERMDAVLKKHEDGSPNFDSRVLTAPVGSGTKLVTRTVLREHLERLFKDIADVALLHFSGHGTVNNLDGYLVTQDAKKYDDGVAMGEVLKLANDSKAREVVILLDCCFSGTLAACRRENAMANYKAFRVVRSRPFAQKNLVVSESVLVREAFVPVWSLSTRAYALPRPS